MAIKRFEIAINGLEELRAALRNLPQELTNEAGVIVQAQAEAAMREMDLKYAEHEWTGALRRGLIMTRDFTQTRFGVRWIVRNRAPHAYWAEYGTEMRETIGRKSVRAGVSRGRMAPLKIFIPIAMRRRRLMVAALTALLRRVGLIVTENDLMSEAA